MSGEDWKLKRLPKLLEKFSDEDIYNADETALYYKATPNGSLTYRNESLSGLKRAMDRITILCCTNMSGSDKKSFLLLEKLLDQNASKELIWINYQSPILSIKMLG
jgi:hypothetical protein